MFVTAANTQNNDMPHDASQVNGDRLLRN